MVTIKKKDFIDRIVPRTTARRKDVKTIIEAFLDEIVVELQEHNRVEFRDFGIFEVAHRKQRVGSNLRTGERMPVPARNVVTFRPAARIKRAINEPKPPPRPEVHISKINPARK